MPKKTIKTAKTSTKTKFSKKAATATKKTTKATKKAAPVVAPPVAPAAPVHAPVLVQKTEAEKIWDTIKNLPIHMFGLPAQIVGQHCTPVPVEPSRLYVIARSPAVLPSLETAVAVVGLEVEMADKFIIVRPSVKPLGTR